MSQELPATVTGTETQSRSLTIRQRCRFPDTAEWAAEPVLMAIQFLEKCGVFKEGADVCVDVLPVRTLVEAGTEADYAGTRISCNIEE